MEGERTKKEKEKPNTMTKKVRKGNDMKINEMKMKP